MDGNLFEAAHRPADWRHVEIELGATDRDVRIRLDGRDVHWVTRLTLTIAAGDSKPARLSLVRVVTHAEAAARGDVFPAGELPRVVDEFQPGPGRTIDVRGIAQLLEDEARASILRDASADPVHAFSIITNDGRAQQLGDMIRDAERYRVLRTIVDTGDAYVAPDGDGPTIRDGDELDAVSDQQIAAERTAAETPRLPT